MKTSVKDVMMRFEALKDQRKEWLLSAKDVTNYILPTRGRYAENKAFEKRSREFNEKALQYLENLASMFMSGITSPARPWLRLKIEDKDMMDWSPAKNWLSEVEIITEAAMRDGGFYSIIHNAYRDLAAHGTACTSVDRARGGKNSILSFKSYQPGEYCAETYEGVLEVLYREVWMSARKMHERWKDRCSTRVKELLKDNPFTQIRIVHAVEPRTIREYGKIDRLNKPFASYWWEYGEDKFLEESGFDLMPYQTARWNANTGETYSSGLGWVALKQAKALNLLQYSATYGVNKAVNPPVIVPDNMYGVNTNPGGINYYQGNFQASQVHPLQMLTSDLAAAERYMTIWQQDLKETFMNDLFIFLMSHPNATATEVISRNEEKLLLLAPTLERILGEMLTPIVDSTIAILMSDGTYPPPPGELEGMKLKPQFIGVLAQAQLQHSTQAINSVVGLVSSLSQINPEVIDKLDCDQAVDAISIIVGTPARVVRTDDQVEEIRSKRSEEQLRVQMQMQQTQDLEEIKTASEAEKNLAIATGAVE